ncbi:MAG: hypothetical protein KAR42_11060 [candidate division Zixibacteria bacterium]|nr:hypothetical protein [candidate division Zixibacteria bacterium]
MSLDNFSNNLFSVTVNGRTISDWGETPTPVTDEPIDQKSTLRRGQSKRAIRLDRQTPGRRVTLNLNPGSPDSAYISGLMNSNANIIYTSTQIGTLEADIGTEGVIVNDGPKGRGGDTITDDQYIIEFNNWKGTKGGT